MDDLYFNKIKVNIRKPKFKFTDTALDHIDYVLVYEKLNPEPSDLDEDGAESEYAKKKKQRILFEERLREQKIEIEDFDGPENKVFLKLFVPFERLCEEAENINLELPLSDCPVYDDDIDCIEKFENKYFVTDDDDDYISATFLRDKFHLYKGSDDPDTFWEFGTRLYLTYNILINTDIRKNLTIDESHKSKIALPKLLMEGVYCDAFALHKPSHSCSFNEDLKKQWLKLSEITDVVAFPEETLVDIQNGRKLNCILSIKDINFNYDYEPDLRRNLDLTWTRMFKYQPMWKIRSYFGEKIAFYFAWSGHLVSYLWFPTLIGIIVFLYGIGLSLNNQLSTVLPTSITNLTNQTGPITTVEPTSEVKKVVDGMLSVLKKSFDNNITPYFAIFVCVWSTIFTEMWKRRRATLAYEWDVDNFEDSEPDRPEFIGTISREDPVTREADWYYPFYRQMMKIITSVLVLLIMIGIVFLSVASVILYRVVMTVKFCPEISSTNCLLLSSIVSSLLNAVSILILGKIYDILAFKLTDWENHRLQSEYDNALITKLFVFQFANSYTSLFYIAFFRGETGWISTGSGIFGTGSQYKDTCGTDNNCMSMLSFEVLILMLTKPLPKLLKDIILPFFVGLIRRCRERNRCRSSCCNSQVGDMDDKPKYPTDVNAFMLSESEKPDLGDFTIEEYMDKIIQYGYLVLFATSFPLAPIICLLTNMIDRVVDGKRMLWLFRRPVPFIVQDIGIWEYIVDFLNICGVVSNALLIAFTSAWSKDYDLAMKCIIVLIIEHAVFCLKFIIAALIPDIPSHVELSSRREKFQVQKILDEGDIKAAKKSPTKDSKSLEQEVRQRNTNTTTFNVDEIEPGVEKRKSKHRKRKRKKQPTQYDTLDRDGDVFELSKIQPQSDLNDNQFKNNDNPLV